MNAFLFSRCGFLLQSDFQWLCRNHATQPLKLRLFFLPDKIKHNEETINNIMMLNSIEFKDKDKNCGFSVKDILHPLTMTATHSFLK